MCENGGRNSLVFDPFRRQTEGRLPNPRMCDNFASAKNYYSTQSAAAFAARIRQ